MKGSSISSDKTATQVNNEIARSAMHVERVRKALAMFNSCGIDSSYFAYHVPASEFAALKRYCGFPEGRIISEPRILGLRLIVDNLR